MVFFSSIRYAPTVSFNWSLHLSSFNAEQSCKFCLSHISVTHPILHYSMYMGEEAVRALSSLDHLTVIESMQNPLQTTRPFRSIKSKLLTYGFKVNGYTFRVVILIVASPFLLGVLTSGRQAGRHKSYSPL